MIPPPPEKTSAISPSFAMKALGVTDLPIERIAQAVQPTPAQRAALDELKDASVKAAEGLKVNCPTYQALTPTGRVEAMEKRLKLRSAR